MLNTTEFDTLNNIDNIDYLKYKLDTYIHLLVCNNPLCLQSRFQQ